MMTLKIKNLFVAALFALAVALASLQPTYADGTITPKGTKTDQTWLGKAPAPAPNGGANWG